MKHGPMNLDFTVYEPDALRMALGQSWPVKIHGRAFMAEVISIRKVDGLGVAATLRTVVTLETPTFAPARGSFVWDDTVGT